MRVEVTRMQSISTQKVCRPCFDLQNSSHSPISEKIWVKLGCLCAFWPFVKGNCLRLLHSPWELNGRTSQEASVTTLFYKGNWIVLKKLWMCKFVLTSNLKNEIENVGFFKSCFRNMLKIHFIVLFSFPFVSHWYGTFITFALFYDTSITIV